MGFQSAASIHCQAEAKRLAYEDRARYYADPHFAKIPIEWLKSKAYAAERAKLIKPDSILTPIYPGQAPSHGDTTYFTVADSDGMMISIIQSNFRGMGSGLVAERRLQAVGASLSALVRYDFRPYPGRITLLRALRGLPELHGDRWGGGPR